MTSSALHLPIVDIRPLVTGQGDPRAAAALIGEACREHGFFYVVGHGVEEGLLARLEAVSREFFALPEAEKQAIAMAKGGRAWRGYFPVGGELTSGLPDQKEGIYFGEELEADHPRVAARTPMHGANLWPAHPAAMREVVLEYLEALTTLAHRVMEGIALSLGLEPGYFAARYTADPLVLFRIFHYPPIPEGIEGPVWSVGEHTDYGLLTLLRQDDRGGLQVKTRAGWIDAPPVEGSFVCNIGDMLDRMTCGLYRSTPHRVLNRSGRGRLSFPFFFDPGFETAVEPIDPGAARGLDDDWRERWDRASVHAFRGRYGDYVQSKVAKVFPSLWAESVQQP